MAARPEPPQVITADPKLVQRLSPHLRRVLVVDPGSAAQRLLAELLRSLGAQEVACAGGAAAALAQARQLNPQMVFTESTGEGFDGAQFTRLIRRSELACRMAPVIMVAAEATPRAIFGARDAGVHEFLRKPFTMRDLLRRLDAVILQPRDWIEGIAYIGPDRRRFNSADYQGDRKRRSDGVQRPEASRVLQAMKIVQAAYAVLETDPAQAHRALSAQAHDIQASAVAGADLKLAAAAGDLKTYLAAAGPAGMAAPAVASHMRTLWSLLPPEMEAEAAASAA